MSHPPFRENGRGDGALCRADIVADHEITDRLLGINHGFKIFIAAQLYQGMDEPVRVIRALALSQMLP